MAAMYQVLLYGSYFCDIIYTGLPEFPSLGKELYSAAFDFRPGGCYNTALALHRLGVHCGWACDFGSDFFSQFVLERARQDGIDGSLFEHYPFPVRRITSALSFPEDRAFVSFADPDYLSPAGPLLAQWKPDWLLLPHLHYLPQEQHIFAAARQAGTRIYMDCQSMPVTLQTPGVAQALGAVDVFAPNLREALALTGTDTVEGALEILAALTPLVVLKLGAAGAVARREGQTIHSPALPIPPLAVVDTTGAGDCFNAGFLYGALRGLELDGCLQAGNVCGGLSVTGHGGAAAPDAAEVERRLLEDSSFPRSAWERP